MKDEVIVSELLLDLDTVAEKIVSLEPSVENVMVATKLITSYVEMAKYVECINNRRLTSAFTTTDQLDALTEWKTIQASVNKEVETARDKINENRQSIVGSVIIQYLRDLNFNISM